MIYFLAFIALALIAFFVQEFAVSRDLRPAAPRPEVARKRQPAPKSGIEPVPAFTPMPNGIRLAAKLRREHSPVALGGNVATSA